MNLLYASDNIVKGGRSGNPITATWDNQFLIKTISFQEKNSFANMFKDLYYRLIKGDTLLCNIYGLYRIKIRDKAYTYIIIMHNMCTINPLDIHLTFDLKGSTVDRLTLTPNEIHVLKNPRNLKSSKDAKKRIIQRKKDVVLKDEDFRILDFKLNLSNNDKYNFLRLIKEDANFLKSFNITDYSLLLTVFNRRSKNNLQKNEENLRRPNRGLFESDDKLFFYQISIIDYLSEYDFAKMGEILAKSLKLYMIGEKDINISAQSSEKYCERLITYSYGLLKSEY